ncbi:uncharacterized protein CC84DRAFT_784537 [Paraphaeosphaeria sporulosa]|uniref:Uncharacterized protein n=1 Tax=Paraphaeosphaeria sporulosa TaxID=1460663 RepID=A0A177CHR8_9PLEO|nr:uncharacterized protein CC84DRAFT_784537 [Paraphaeosphaeria sporulosa]OAG06502.1 hypothetical protein CC84DRAFT_784537 [Paraphaeosphaeria sporulosa]
MSMDCSIIPEPVSTTSTPHSPTLQTQQTPAGRCISSIHITCINCILTMSQLHPLPPIVPRHASRTHAFSAPHRQRSHNQHPQSERHIVTLHTIRRLRPALPQCLIHPALRNLPTGHLERRRQERQHRQPNTLLHGVLQLGIEMHKPRLKGRQERLEARGLVACAAERVAIDAESEVLDVLSHILQPRFPVLARRVEVCKQGQVGRWKGRRPGNAGVLEEGGFSRMRASTRGRGGRV